MSVCASHIWDLESHPSRLNKEAILAAEATAGNAELFKGIRAALDPMITYGIKQVEEKSFMHDVEASLLYFKMRKVKKMIAQNQVDMEHAKEEDQMLLLQIHKHLKEVERELTKIIGTVIIK
jgi:hypothetical protein